MRSRLLLVGLALFASGTASASAQPAPWLVVPTALVDADPAPTEDAARAVATSLVARGTAVWSLTEAGERYERLVSTPASPLSRSDIEDWVAHSQAAVRHLAHADYAAARRDLLEAQTLSRRAAEELNREAERARQVLDTCLYMVRALVETGDLPRGRAQARECRQLVPRVEPSAFRHTPEVRELLHEVDAAMAAEPPGTLRVESAPHGCSVRLNGIPFGETPFLMDGLAPGEYRLQVECDATFRGRVRRVRLAPGETVVHVDATLERAVRTDPRLALLYDDAETRETHRLAHAQELGRALGASRVLLVEEIEDAVRYDLIDADAGRVLASAWVPARAGGVGPGGASAAAAALGDERSVDLRGGRAAEAEPWAPSSGARRAPRRPTARAAATPAPRRWGLALAGAGGAALSLGWGLHGRRYRLGKELAGTPPQDPDAERVAGAWEDARAPLLASAVVGALASTMGVGLAVPPSRRRAWWTWALGGAGVAFGVAGGVVLGTRPRCVDPDFDPAACVNREEAADLAALLFMSALPLVSIPAAALARDVELGAGAELTIGGARAVVQGRF